MTRRYEIDVRPRAVRRLSGLPEKIATAVAEFIYGPLRDDPYRVGGPLHGKYAGQYSARRGREWRVRYEVDDVAKVVRIFDIDHRSDVYR